MFVCLICFYLTAVRCRVLVGFKEILYRLGWGLKPKPPPARKYLPWILPRRIQKWSFCLDRMQESQFSETPISLSACDLHFLRPLSHFGHALRLWIMFWDSESIFWNLYHFWHVTFKNPSVFPNFRYDRLWINFLRPLCHFRHVTFIF